LNIDGCRIKGTKPDTVRGAGGQHGKYSLLGAQGEIKDDGRGRFPANLILSHSPECKMVGTKKVKGIEGGTGNHPGLVYGNRTNQGEPVKDYADEDGMETMEDWECVEDCPVKIMDEQSGISKSTGGKEGERSNEVYGKDKRPRKESKNAGGLGDKGGASRFFYCAKSSRKERNDGVDDFYWKKTDELFIKISLEEYNQLSEKERAHGNIHPTVKPVALMKYLCRLVTPPGSIILDPFMGSGSTGIAAIPEGFRFKGIDNDPESFEIAKARISFTENKLREVKDETKTKADLSCLDSGGEGS